MNDESTFGAYMGFERVCWSTLKREQSSSDSAIAVLPIIVAFIVHRGLIDNLLRDNPACVLCISVLHIGGGLSDDIVDFGEDDGSKRVHL